MIDVLNAIHSKQAEILERIETKFSEIDKIIEKFANRIMNLDGKVYALQAHHACLKERIMSSLDSVRQEFEKNSKTAEEILLHIEEITNG